MSKSIWMLLFGLVFASRAFAQSVEASEAYLNWILSPEAEELSLYEEPDSVVTPMDVRTLASRDVSPASKTYTAAVSDCARGLKHVRLIVSRVGLTFQGGGVIFSDGTKKETSMTRTFSAGYTSPWISFSYLGANGRCVQSVFVRAKSVDATRDSHVEVQGRFE